MKPNIDEEESTECRYAITRDLTGHLLSALVDRFGDGVTVHEANAPDAGLVTYRFVFNGAVCYAEVTPHNDRWAVLSFLGCLGRVYREYARAFRWLARNRACNTLAIADLGAEYHELWVSANRNTLKGDAAGIRVELDDFCDETNKALTGLKLWFPQFFEADAVARYKDGVERDDKIAEAMENPRAFMRAMVESEEAQQGFPLQYAFITRWLAEWEQNLRINDSEQMLRLAEEVPSLKAALPAARVRALRALRRHEELLNECLPSLPDGAIPPSRKVAIEAECLCELGRAEEALEAVRSADFDDDALVHFVRANACARLRREEEAVSHYAEYESRVGRDMLAAKKLGRSFQQDDEEDGGE